MPNINIKFVEYKQVVFDILNLNLAQLKNKYNGRISYIYSFINDTSLGYSSQNYTYLKRATNEANCSIEIVVSKSQQLINEIVQSNKKDYYKILEVEQNSTNNEIRNNWIRLVKENHPDVKGNNGIEITKELNEAYNILNNKNTRSEYDDSYFNFSPVTVNGTEYSFLENRKFLLGFSFCVVFLLGFLVIGLIDNPVIKKSNTEINALNSKSLTDYQELDGEKLKEQYKEEIDSIYSRYQGSNNIGSQSSVVKEEDNSQSDVNEVIESFGMSDKSEMKIKSEGSLENTREKNIDLLTTENENDLKSLENVNVNSKNEINSKRNNERINTVVTEVDKGKKENELIAAKKKFEEKPPSKSSLFIFVSDYVSAYKNKDFNKIKSLFSASATENGKEWNETMKLYKSNFRNNEIIRYDIIVRDNNIDKMSGYISGNFTVVYKKTDSDSLKKKKGNISWNLEWINNKWVIDSLNYEFLDPNHKL